ncbi:MAG: hypothetical protein PHY85_05825, partial [Bacteroidales bacterium]|nr:hypothetical protein [Bacteroidales bacterium]
LFKIQAKLILFGRIKQGFQVGKMGGNACKTDKAKPWSYFKLYFTFIHVFHGLSPSFISQKYTKFFNKTSKKII